MTSKEWFDYVYGVMTGLVVGAYVMWGYMHTKYNGGNNG